ncbi:MAG: nickel-dependent hydrogenase large subunit [Eggerthellaceae bacterium]|nr:nickel-dependent hydrogenase large subunit [Eggerthellaceae bacterium]
MTRSVIDPITRIEGHMRCEMEVEGGKVVDAWVSGGSFRGMEKVVEHRAPEDAAQIVQRICGVCPVSHSHASTIAAEKSYGITIPNNARIIRNLIEGAQFLHSHILWFYNLAALDYVNPLNALTADIADTYALAQAAGTSMNSDFAQVQERLKKFAANGQLSIFSGNWFDAEDGTAYTMPPELDLICTAHYLEALKMQARSSEVAGLLGGKMPHVMTIIPGGTAFVPTAQKLDDLWAMVNEIYDWVSTTMIQDTLALAPFYKDGLTWGGGCGRFGAWGVFEGPGWPYGEDYTEQMNNRYLPAGVLMNGLEGKVDNVDESKIAEYVGTSWYKGSETYQSPYFVTEPEFTEYNVEERYSWCKAPSYDGKALECSALSRVLVAYKRGVPFITENVDKFLKDLGGGLGLDGAAPASAVVSMLGRTAVRQIETLYIAQLMKDWTQELIAAVAGGDSTYFTKSLTDSGAGTGFWEAPRGALYHSEKVAGGKIEGYQIIIPTTWNLAPINQNGEHGPIEQALIGCPVGDIEKPINALRLVHSYDPCVSCAVHVSEPATGKHFETVTNPWGVK